MLAKMALTHLITTSPYGLIDFISRNEEINQYTPY